MPINPGIAGTLTGGYGGGTSAGGGGGGGSFGAGLPSPIANALSAVATAQHITTQAKIASAVRSTSRVATTSKPGVKGAPISNFARKPVTPTLSAHQLHVLHLQTHPGAAKPAPAKVAPRSTVTRPVVTAPRPVAPVASGGGTSKAPTASTTSGGIGLGMVALIAGGLFLLVILFSRRRKRR